MYHPQPPVKRRPGASVLFKTHSSEGIPNSSTNTLTQRRTLIEQRLNGLVAASASLDITGASSSGSTSHVVAPTPAHAREALGIVSVAHAWVASHENRRVEYKKRANSTRQHLKRVEQAKHLGLDPEGPNLQGRIDEAIKQRTRKIESGDDSDTLKANTNSSSSKRRRRSSVSSAITQALMLAKSAVGESGSGTGGGDERSAIDNLQKSTLSEDESLSRSGAGPHTTNTNFGTKDDDDVDDTDEGSPLIHPTKFFGVSVDATEAFGFSQFQQDDDDDVFNQTTASVSDMIGYEFTLPEGTSSFRSSPLKASQLADASQKRNHAPLDESLHYASAFKKTRDSRSSRLEEKYTLEHMDSMATQNPNLIVDSSDGVIIRNAAAATSSTTPTSSHQQQRPSIDYRLDPLRQTQNDDHDFYDREEDRDHDVMDHADAFIHPRSVSAGRRRGAAEGEASDDDDDDDRVPASEKIERAIASIDHDSFVALTSPRVARRQQQRLIEAAERRPDEEKKNRGLTITAPRSSTQPSTEELTASQKMLTPLRALAQVFAATGASLLDSVNELDDETQRIHNAASKETAVPEKDSPTTIASANFSGTASPDSSLTNHPRGLLRRRPPDQAEPSPSPIVRIMTITSAEETPRSKALLLAASAASPIQQEITLPDPTLVTDGGQLLPEDALLFGIERIGFTTVAAAPPAPAKDDEDASNKRTQEGTPQVLMSKQTNNSRTLSNTAIIHSTTTTSTSIISTNRDDGHQDQPPSLSERRQQQQPLFPQPIPLEAMLHTYNINTASPSPPLAHLSTKLAALKVEPSSPAAAGFGDNLSEVSHDEDVDKATHHHVPSNHFVPKTPAVQRLPDNRLTAVRPLRFASAKTRLLAPKYPPAVAAHMQTDGAYTNDGVGSRALVGAPPRREEPTPSFPRVGSGASDLQRQETSQSTMNASSSEQQSHLASPASAHQPPRAAFAAGVIPLHPQSLSNTGSSQATPQRLPLAATSVSGWYNTSVLNAGIPMPQAVVATTTTARGVTYSNNNNKVSVSGWHLSVQGSPPPMSPLGSPRSMAGARRSRYRGGSSSAFSPRAYQQISARALDQQKTYLKQMNAIMLRALAGMPDGPDVVDDIGGDTCSTLQAAQDSSSAACAPPVAAIPHKPSLLNASGFQQRPRNNTVVSHSSTSSGATGEDQTAMLLQQRQQSSTTTLLSSPAFPLGASPLVIGRSHQLAGLPSFFSSNSSNALLKGGDSTSLSSQQDAVTLQQHKREREEREYLLCQMDSISIPRYDVVHPPQDIRECRYADLPDDLRLVMLRDMTLPAVAESNNAPEDPRWSTTNRLGAKATSALAARLRVGQATNHQSGGATMRGSRGEDKKAPHSSAKLYPHTVLFEHPQHVAIYTQQQQQQTSSRTATSKHVSTGGGNGNSRSRVGHPIGTTTPNTKSTSAVGDAKFNSTTNSLATASSTHHLVVSNHMMLDPMVVALYQRISRGVGPMDNQQQQHGKPSSSPRLECGPPLLDATTLPAGLEQELQQAIADDASPEELIRLLHKYAAP